MSIRKSANRSIRRYPARCVVKLERGCSHSKYDNIWTWRACMVLKIQAQYLLPRTSFSLSSLLVGSTIVFASLDVSAVYAVALVVLPLRNLSKSAMSDALSIAYPAYFAMSTSLIRPQNVSVPCSRLCVV